MVTFYPVSDQLASVVNIIFLPGTLGTGASDPARDCKAQLWKKISESNDRKIGFINVKSCRHPLRALKQIVSEIFSISCLSMPKIQGLEVLTRFRNVGQSSNDLFDLFSK